VLDILIGRGRGDADETEKVGLGPIRRPVIGLALGGGAARGFAHIGVLRTLLAHGIVPNIVVGTSIGAVVGGAYAAGFMLATALLHAAGIALGFAIGRIAHGRAAYQLGGSLIALAGVAILTHLI